MYVVNEKAFDLMISELKTTEEGRRVLANYDLNRAKGERELGILSKKMVDVLKIMKG